MGSIVKREWGRLSDGRLVNLYTLENASGMTMRVTDYGCIVVSLTARDRSGQFADVVLGFDSPADYEKTPRYFGALVGRYGNRIGHGRFTLDGSPVTLSLNNEPGGVPCHLHGGKEGLDKKLWMAESVERESAVGLKFRFISPDGDEGYPGELDMTVHYWLTDADELRIEYEAVTNRPTPVNLTHHGYFNLAGHDAGTILDHEIVINADHITPVDKGMIPTGERMPVEGTPFDFRQSRRIGDRIDERNDQIQFAPGYDHNYVLRGWNGALRSALTLHEPTSGRTMEILTTEPGIQFYTGNFLDGTDVGKGGCVYPFRAGMCLEPQHFPDSPNKADFPSTILRPGDVYRQQSVYLFRAE
ncbi:MAG: galactose mutarotase [Phycisphaerales bacterium]|nr:galactose mutarotase [Phycisphaerales bacterium]